MQVREHAFTINQSRYRAGNLVNRLNFESGHSVARRRLLSLAPFVGVAGFAPTLSFAGAGSSDASVGVLLPNNERIPGLRIDWRLGFQSELLAAKATFQPQYLEYSVGSYRALAAAQSLLDGGCTTLTGIFNRNLATHLGESLDRHSAKFLVSDLGANAIRGNPTCDRLIRVGPDLWRQAYLAGQHFAQLGAKRALIATSFYEAGYDLPNAFQLGFMTADGGSADIVVTGTPDVASNDQEFAALADALSGNRFDVLFSLYSGREATRYLKFAQSINGRVGTIAALSPLLHGLPQSAVVSASAMAVQVVTSGAADNHEGNSAQTIYTSMGRFAARAVLASIGSDCSSSPEWFTTIARTTGVSLATRAAPAHTKPSPTAFASSLRSSLTSGWIAPYGA